MTPQPRPKLTLFNLVVFGTRAVGKRCLMYRICLNAFCDTYYPNFDESYGKMEHFDNETIAVRYFNASGEDDKAFRENWMHACDGALFMYSIDSQQSFNRIEGLVEELKQIKIRQGIWDGFPICLVGNKLDLRGAERMPPIPLPWRPGVPGNQDGAQFPPYVIERGVTTEEGSKLAAQLGCAFVECSTKEGTGCQEVVSAVLRARKMQREKLKAEATTEVESKIEQDEKAEKPRKRRWRRVLARLSC